ncbi:er-associated proteolytic system protein der1 [Diplodia corticola]|uniref:Derlin n=1 Tax=Diplodia corticola TaxID=236234 RepID=A0A1J9QPW4_9PEZI|nr:er-associated proteolytic system protein der1 [Diplodia corticola]OJD30066.1 er-associated proteolytic system protein der1 [Diplodia corticola]
MAAVLGGGDGMVGQLPLEQWFYELPVCTRWWTTVTVVLSVLVQCHVISPFQLFYSYRAVIYKHQWWRAVSTFFYFGPLSLDLLFHVFFLQRYSRLLEEGFGRSPAHFSWLLAYASAVLLVVAPMFSMGFLGSALNSTLVYIWSRKNPDTSLSFLGLVVFKAPFLPWVLALFSMVLHGTVPKDDMLGIVVGHVWYFFNDVYPPMNHGQRPLDPPSWWVRLWEGRPAAEETAAEVIDRDIAAVPTPELR